ncbi:MAG: DUF4867 family protein [Cyanobacteria bacterium]|nr:DUF4867 family protein [Cyanobacteriota bacterium]
MNDILKKLNELNPGRNIVSADDKSFRQYGTIHKRFKIDKLMKYLEKDNQVKEEVVYIADVPELLNEYGDELKPIINGIYAGMDVQAGRCLAINNKLNALEYHQGSETYISGTDMVMLLGLEQDIVWPKGTYDSSKIKAFYAPKGRVIELKGGCMHFVGINVYQKEGINVVVMLLKGTNTKFEFNKDQNSQDKLIIAKNTWFLAHSEYKQAKDAGYHLGLTLPLLTFKTL